MTGRPSPARVHLFVYGSLKTGYENAHILSGATYMGTARTAPGYRLIRYQDGYPALLPVAGDADSVTGELYSVDAAHLAAIDAFEECPTLYRRVLIELDDGRSAAAYVVPEGSGTHWPRLERY